MLVPARLFGVVAIRGLKSNRVPGHNDESDARMRPSEGIDCVVELVVLGGVHAIIHEQHDY